MDKKLRLLKDIKSDCCVTIILNTHRTKPENQKDAIVLKNLIKEAESRLYEHFDKRFAKQIHTGIQKLSEKINHNYNLDSLILFVNEDIAEFIRLAVPVENRVIIDKTFATRDLIRASHQQISYYCLVLSRQKARLIEAQNDLPIKEFDDTWPIDNDMIFTTDKHKLSMAAGQDVLIEEFFNQVDKVVLSSIKDHPLPIMVVTEERNYNHYLKVADRKDLIIGHLNMNRDDKKAHHIVKDAWPVVKKIFKQKREERISELGKAVGSGKLLTDINEIWSAVNQGRGNTLFIKKGFFQPAVIKDNMVHPQKDTTNNNESGFIDDIIDEIVEINMKYGGDSVFIENDYLNKYNGLALIVRY